MNNLKLSGFLVDKRPIFKGEKGNIIDFVIDNREEGFKNVNFTLIAFGEKADMIDSLQIGQELAIEGKLQTKTYGSGKKFTKALAESIELLGGRKPNIEFANSEKAEGNEFF